MSSLHSQITNARASFYEGGKKTKANQDFWNATDSFESTATPDRDTLRARARWLSANNAIMNNIDNAIINNVVGTGITLQSNTGKKRYDDEVEKRWKKWAGSKSCDLTGRFNFYTLQRLILKARMVDGEIFIYKKIVKGRLKLHLIECDLIDTSRTDGGVETGMFNEVVAYHFSTYDRNTYKETKFRIPVEDIINYYTPERSSQYRGVSEYKQAILDIKNFSAFQTATIQAMRARANIAYVVKQEGNPKLLGADLTNQIQTVNGVSVQYLKKGETISKLDPDSPPTDYVSFSENTIRLMATARNVSYELSFRDYSKVNFASSRASILQDFKRFDEEQRSLTDYILNNIFEAWLDLEIMTGRIKANGYFQDPEPFINSKWIMPNRIMVDPLKEITAIEKAIKLNLSTEIDEANARGLDYEELLEKKAKELELKKKYDIPLNNIAGLSYYEEEQIITPSKKSSSDDSAGEDNIGNDDNLTGAESKLDK